MARDDLRTELARLADGVASRLRADGLAARTITLKIRDATFQTITRAKTLPRPIDSAAAITETVHGLLDKAPPSAGVRLLGVAASKFAEPAEQLQLDGIDDGREPRWSDASRAIDRVRGRFGGAAIGPASSLVTGRAAGRAPWPAPMGDRRSGRKRRQRRRPALRNRRERVRMGADGYVEETCLFPRTNSGSSGRSSNSSNGIRHFPRVATACPATGS